MMGVTNPSEAAPGTIRGDFGLVTTEKPRPRIRLARIGPPARIALFFPLLSRP